MWRTLQRAAAKFSSPSSPWAPAHGCTLKRAPLFTFLFPACLLLTSYAAAADFAGNQACASCHAEIYRSYMATPMARGSGRVGTEDPKESFSRAEFRDSKGAFTYRVSPDSFEFHGTKQPIQGRRQLDYFIGSGAHARSYLLNVDGFLFEAPVSYFSDSASWKAAPGYASNDFPYLTRPIQPGCLACHSSGIQRIPGTENAYASPPFRESGVACERCHGLGSEHIASGAPMVNPAKLAPAERDSICEQCHLSGEIRVPKAGQDDLSFVPGQRLSDVLSVFVKAGSESEVRVTSHVENLAASACKRASGDKLWCGTCHDPHTVPPTNQKAAYYRGKCLSCHETSNCRAPRASRQANGDNCVTCHMPHNPTSDIEHVVFTDHSIRRKPTPAADPSREYSDLALFGGGKSNARDLGLAYAMAGLREDNRAYLASAFQFLKDAVAEGPADPLALAYLAQFYRERKDDARALPLYEEAYRMGSTDSAVYQALGAYWMQLGNRDQAILFWDHALSMNPGLLLTRVNLADALVRAGRKEEAQATLRKALEFNPAFQPARDLLNRIAK